jgi:hypothetical protein
LSAKYCLPGLALLALPLAARGADVDRLPDWEAKAHALILPAEKESQWKRIPWVTDLDEAVKTAKKEKRPLLLWTAGDDPLERC